MKYTAILCMLLASYAYWQHFSLQRSQENNIKLQQQNRILLQQQNQLKKQTEEYNAAQQKANIQISKLKDLAQKNKDNCYNNPIPAAYLKLVHSTYNKH